MHVYSKWHLLHQSTQVTGQVVNLREKKSCMSVSCERKREREREAKRRRASERGKKATIDLWAVSRASCQHEAREWRLVTGLHWSQVESLNFGDITPGQWLFACSYSRCYFVSRCECVCVCSFTFVRFCHAILDTVLMVNHLNLIPHGRRHLSSTAWSFPVHEACEFVQQKISLEKKKWKRRDEEREK